MRVERVGVDKVRERLEQQKRQAEESLARTKKSAIDEYEGKLKQNEEELAAWKQKRKEQREAEKKSKAEEEEDDDEVEGMDPDMAAMMGFSGFGGGKK